MEKGPARGPDIAILLALGFSLLSDPSCSIILHPNDPIKLTTSERQLQIMNLFFHSRTHESISLHVATMARLDLERENAELQNSLQKATKHSDRPRDTYQRSSHHQPQQSGKSFFKAMDAQRREALRAQNAESLAVVGKAMSTNVCVELGYEDSRSLEDSKRLVVPQGLFLSDKGDLMLTVARRLDDGNVCTLNYRADRITSAQLTKISAQSMLAGPLGAALAESVIR